VWPALLCFTRRYLNKFLYDHFNGRKHSTAYERVSLKVYTAVMLFVLCLFLLYQNLYHLQKKERWKMQVLYIYIYVINVKHKSAAIGAFAKTGRHEGRKMKKVSALVCNLLFETISPVVYTHIFNSFSYRKLLFKACICCICCDFYRIFPVTRYLSKTLNESKGSTSHIFD